MPHLGTLHNSSMFDREQFEACATTMGHFWKKTLMFNLATFTLGTTYTLGQAKFNKTSFCRSIIGDYLSTWPRL